MRRQYLTIQNLIQITMREGITMLLVIMEDFQVVGE